MLRSMRTASIRSIVLVLVAVAVSVGFIASHFGTIHQQSHLQLKILISNNSSRPLLTSPHRKLLIQEDKNATTLPDRAGPEGGLCRKRDLAVNQGATAPLPSGIPTYTVNIINVCSAGCKIHDIHLSCKWFSSARTINPKVFRRLGYDDCLVNDGQPILPGGSVSYQYANTFPFPMGIKSLKCSM